MIEITDGFTGISAGTDSMDAVNGAHAPRRPTGARVTVEFRRTSSLSPDQAVTVRYDFAADGNVREFTGIPTPIQTIVRVGRAVMYHYRLSHWIDASELMDFPGKAGRRTEVPEIRPERQLRGERGDAPMLRIVAGARAIDPSPA